MDRKKRIVRVSLAGIATNLALSAAKAVIGWISGSIAIVMDALNNLSDVLSSVMTVIGTKMAGKAPDKEHPLGHGRIEYITAMLIAIIVIGAGVTATWESVQKILHPTMANYGWTTFLVIILAVIAKLILGRYFTKRGRELNSQALVASGLDAKFDAVLSASTLIGAVANMGWGVSIEGWLGLIIAIFVIKAGMDILLESFSSIIGARVDPLLQQQVKDVVAHHEGVRGVYDLVLNRYGPETIIGSVFVELPDDMTAIKIHHLTRHLAMEIYDRFGIVLTVGIYASNTDDPGDRAIHNRIAAIAEEYPQVLQMHGFFVDHGRRMISFDLIIDPGEEDPEGLRREIHDRVAKEYPSYQVAVVFDNDFNLEQD